MWIAFITPVAALLGVVLTLMVQGRQARLERQARVKHDVFLEAAAEIGNRSNIFNALAHGPLDDVGKVGAAVSAGATSKLQLIAGIPLIEALTVADRTALRGMLSILNSRVDTELAKLETDSLAHRLEALRALPPTSVDSAEVKRLIEEHGKAHDKQERLMVQTGLEAMKATTDHAASLALALVEGRKELGIDATFDPKRYLQLQSETVTEATTGLKELFDRLLESSDE